VQVGDSQGVRTFVCLTKHLLLTAELDDSPGYTMETRSCGHQQHHHHHHAGQDDAVSPGPAIWPRSSSTHPRTTRPFQGTRTMACIGLSCYRTTAMIGRQ
jgi:hypothetical protein